jgi:phage terminase large subunit
MTPTIIETEAEFPEKLAFLLDPHQHAGECGNRCGRYKVPYGGRGGLKSYAAADAALLRGADHYERVLCIRETMDSIAESVHHLLEQRIHALKLTDKYKVEKSTIYSRNSWPGSGPTQFIFLGVRNDTMKIKSLEGVTILWAEEAHGISDASWDIVIPTIRWQDAATGRKSEIWVGFNPRYSTDATYKRFVLNPPGSAIVCRTDYRDNPWFPDVLRAEMERDKRENPDKYRHIWLGEPDSEVQGAIFGEQMKAADAEGRIGDIPWDRTKPVDTFWDLGFGDLNAIWFAQAVAGWYHFIDYAEGNGKTIADWLILLQSRGYVYGVDWLPHDGVDAMIHKRLTGDMSKSPEQLLRAAGRNVRVAPKLEKMTRINAARTIFPQSRFDRARCSDGLQRLRHYQWGPVSNLGVQRREPLHDDASHGADAYCTAGVCIKQPPAPKATPQQPQRRHLSAWA